VQKDRKKGKVIISIFIVVIFAFIIIDILTAGNKKSGISTFHDGMYKSEITSNRLQRGIYKSNELSGHEVTEKGGFKLRRITKILKKK